MEDRSLRMCSRLLIRVGYQVRANPAEIDAFMRGFSVRGNSFTVARMLIMRGCGKYARVVVAS